MTSDASIPSPAAPTSSPARCTTSPSSHSSTAPPTRYHGRRIPAGGPRAPRNTATLAHAIPARYAATAGRLPGATTVGAVRTTQPTERAFHPAHRDAPRCPAPDGGTRVEPRTDAVTSLASSPGRAIATRPRPRPTPDGCASQVEP